MSHAQDTHLTQDMHHTQDTRLTRIEHTPGTDTHHTQDACLTRMGHTPGIAHTLYSQAGLARPFPGVLRIVTP